MVSCNSSKIRHHGVELNQLSSITTLLYTSWADKKDRWNIQWSSYAFVLITELLGLLHSSSRKDWAGHGPRKWGRVWENGHSHLIGSPQYVSFHLEIWCISEGYINVVHELRIKMDFLWATVYGFNSNFEVCGPTWSYLGTAMNFNIYRAWEYTIH
jgi:hypothetical protein